MNKYLNILPLCAALAMTLPVASFAQTATTETTTEPGSGNKDRAGDQHD